MAMKKAEMEEHRAAYYRGISESKAARADGNIQNAITLALDSCEHIDGMMRYERKYEERTFGSVEAIDLVLALAPLVFNRDSIEKLAALLKTIRQIEKNTSADMAAKLSDATMLMGEAHRLWFHLETHEVCRQHELSNALGGSHAQWEWISEQWESIGLIRRTVDRESYRLRFRTRMDEVVTAKCASCGVRAKAAKAKFLSPVHCPKCQNDSEFVILSPDPGQAA
jgi:predicted Zn-ribbon and HTH transcriptional regulator